MPVIDVDHGTPEQAWRNCARLRTLPELTWSEPCCVVVIAPHPDDETLGIGGTLCTLARRGFAIQVIALTDCERASVRRHWLAWGSSTRR
jgi:LmbE family N-acetylglucosaminyl deacetylase